MSGPRNSWVLSGVIALVLVAFALSTISWHLGRPLDGGFSDAEMLGRDSLMMDAFVYCKNATITIEPSVIPANMNVWHAGRLGYYFHCTDGSTLFRGSCPDNLCYSKVDPIPCSLDRKYEVMDR